LAHILFIGNGPNRLAGAASWRDVLVGLAEYVQKRDVILRHIDEKPFTLVFEEVFLRAARSRRLEELQLKKEAARLVDGMRSGEFHSKLMGLGTRHVLTTNYDYNLEKGTGLHHSDASIRAEQRYSLFRRRQIGEQSVWHIHGEVSVPTSLALGHDHYSGSLHHIRDYLVTRGKRANPSDSPFMRGVLNFDQRGGAYSWMDIFLRDDVHIFGFSMDYTEIELWWLLSFKERLGLRGHEVGRTLFYSCEPHKVTERERAKLAILESYGVEVVRLRASTHAEAFSRFINSFHRHSS
jgi:hypothetical protein